MNYVKIVKGMVGTDLQCKGQSRRGQSPNYHYKIVFNTPAKGEDGQPGKVDDFQPQANIEAQFSAGQIKGPTSIHAFASEFSVDESLGQNVTA